MSTETAVRTGIVDLILNASPVVQLVLLLLVFSSVFCWAIIYSKSKTLKSADRQDQTFLEAFWKARDLEEVISITDQLHESPVAAVFKSGYKEFEKLTRDESRGPSTMGTSDIENVSRALARASNNEISNLEKNIGYLATTASAAPFIGLFGTVWGIMNSFRGIASSGGANLAVVAPGISEALIATAIGLAAAIPAVIGYNHFVNKIKRVAVDMDCFSQDFLNLLQRSIMSGKK